MKNFTIFIFFISTIVFAQTDSITQKTSSKIKVYTPASSSNSSSSDNSYKWVVKTDLFSYVSGEFPIIGEYRFSKKWSAEASAGVTYAYLDAYGIFDDETPEAEPLMGSSFRGALKYYPSSDYDAIEGWSFGIQVFSRTNKIEYVENGYSTINSSGSGVISTKNKTGLALILSKQIFWDSNICFEYILGIGFASVKHDFSELEYDNTASEYIFTPKSTKETLPNFQLGFRIGFGN